MIIFHMSNWNDRRNGFPEGQEVAEIDTSTCPYQPPTSAKGVLTYRHSAPGKEVKPGTELRILCVGDSITVGYLSDRNGGDGNGYRLQMRNDLSKDKVVYAGTVSAGTMKDGYFAGWSGKTIQYIADHVGPSLKRRPNVILVHAGTNDMNPNHDISSEGNDPAGAADRLGKLIDQMIEACPDAVILVAMIVNTCDQNQWGATKEYQKLVPGVVRARQDHGHDVLAGLEGRKTCKTTPHWYGTGEIALGGVGHNGDWHYNKDWVAAGEVASGLGRDPRYVRRALGEIAGGVGTAGSNIRWADLQGTGRASYVAVDPGTGAIPGWLNGCDDIGDPHWLSVSCEPMALLGSVLTRPE
ncbi:hypothetical protein PG988_005531 [Apiospora saccharicola]